MSTPKVGDVVRALAERFPPERAEAWDRVGLLAGDPARELTGVALALDPTRTAIETAAKLGANLLVTHHPAFLEPPSAICPGPGPGGTVFAALDRGVALLNAHTNLDRDAAAQRLIPERLSLTALEPLESAPMPLALVTAYVPAAHVQPMREAMEQAGAGRIGDYRGCAFVGEGMGSFTPGSASEPFVGTPGVLSDATESRVEMVCPRAAAARVVAAATSAHPYEEPLVTASEVAIARNAAALGMVCEVASAGVVTLADLSALASRAYAVSARVWGDEGRPVRRVATTTGSGGSLIGDALRAGVDVLVAGEVRYHDALDALENGLAIIELGHDVTEWPLVGLLEQVVRGIDGLDPTRVHVLSDHPHWRTVST